MGAQFDLITPVVILGILILMVLAMNRFMQESTAETRLIHQNQAGLTIVMQVLQEELKGLTDVTALTDSTIRYVTASSDSVRIYRMGDAMLVRRRPQGGVPDTLRYDVGLTAIRFTLTSQAGEAPFFLRVRLTAENAATQRDFYLRNLE